MTNNNEDQQKVVTENPLKGIEEDYIEQIKNLKQNSVPKETFEALEAEHKRLIGELVNGQGPTVEVITSKPDIAQMRRELYDPNAQFSNIEYCSRTLALRKAIMDEGEMDPFLPIGPNVKPTSADEEAAQRVADVIQECLDIADGNNDIFTAALQSRMTDNIMPTRRKEEVKNNGCIFRFIKCE